MRQINVIHLVNKISPTSIPTELAVNMGGKRVKVSVVSYFDKKTTINRSTLGGKGVDMIGLGATSRLDFSVIQSLYNLFKQKEPDILHVHHNWSSFIGRIIAKKIGKIFIVDTEHTDHLKTRSPGIFLNSLTIGLSDKVVCNSKNTCGSFFSWENWVVGPDKKKIIYNGVDIREIDKANLENRSMERRFNLKPSDYVIGNIGMLRKAKNQKSLIKAFKQVLSEISEAKLVIVGSGGLKADLRQLANNLGVSDRLIFTGLLDRDEVYQLLHVFDVFAMVSLWEGFCNAVVEAMVAGVPVVVSDVEPLPEVVGNAGKYVSPKDSEDIAEAIINIQRNPEKAKELAAVGRERAKKKFSLEKSVSEYKDLYKSLLKEKKMPGIN